MYRRKKWIRDQVTARNMEQMLDSHEKKLPRAPYLKPPFTLSEVKKAIPPHCFERSVLRSFSHLVFDITMSFCLYSIFARYVITAESVASKTFFLIKWIIYSLLQGCVISRLWAIGHECGHYAFSEYKWLDDTVGYFVHSFLLFPYFSFKYSHRRHHSKTGSLHQEELDVPLLKSQVPLILKHLTNPAARFLALTLLLTFGVPLYLLVNFRGRAYDRFASHFNPFSPMFSRNQRAQILLSDAGILTMACGLYKLVLIKGFSWVALTCGGPYLVLNAIIMAITILNHTHPFVPYYDSTEWDWLRGSFATIDRDIGVFNMVLHKASKTHVAHHLFPTIPHYHAEEATRAIKPILGEYYQYDDSPFYKSLWSTVKECVYVEEDQGEQNKGLYWYSNKF
ncbi:Omega-6 fatty acid desaturase, endoplasmic reticulum isozyme 2 [Heracleum sosnowskyi]|uniref:Omega-6 fatty acid desaturase, endoplasmic reticulum isozyme 2 n=1 Tax=Heracleum sosnowskyi TaxID=360622 RepID=A0AAD8GYI6_9APIA|nr:Omega-6 fatty acid desaturase, endoplasmic reticulum isozyme 2 [Heracleum sosnowskyi]